MAYWWVSQNQTFQHERAGGYLWAPTADKAGAVPHHWATMLEVRPGDIVFSYVGQRIPAISVATTQASDSPRPADFRATVSWEQAGRRVDVQYQRADAMSGTERRQAIRPMTVDQLAKFLRAAETPRQIEATEARRDATPAEQWRDRRGHALFLTLADAGLRPGEALALKWDDVNLADRSLRVERAVSSGEIKATKTGEARTVDLTTRLAQALGRWRAHAVEAEAVTPDGERSQPTARRSQWVFPSDAGTPLDEHRVAKWFRGLLAAAKLPHFRLYDLRHTFATHLLAESAPITYVAAQLGHAKPTTTLAFYAHWLPRGDKGLIDRLERARRTA